MLRLVYKDNDKKSLPYNLVFPEAWLLFIDRLNRSPVPFLLETL